MSRHQVELYEIPFRLRGICGRALNIPLPLAVWKRRLKITVKRNRRAAPVFSWEMYKNICWSSSARDHRDFQHEKRYDTNFNVISSASGKGLLPSAAALACAFHDFLENRMELINGLAVFFGNGHMAQSGFITLFAFFIFGNRVTAVAF